MKRASITEELAYGSALERLTGGEKPEVRPRKKHSTGTAENWTLIAAGALSLPSARNTVGPTVEFPNDTYYQSFRLIFPTVKNPVSANSMQLAELQLDANDIGSPQPAALPIPDVTNNGDSIIAIDLDGDSSSPPAEGPANTIDNTLGRYLTGTRYAAP